MYFSSSFGIEFFICTRLVVGPNAGKGNNNPHETIETEGRTKRLHKVMASAHFLYSTKLSLDLLSYLRGLPLPNRKNV